MNNVPIVNETEQLRHENQLLCEALQWALDEGGWRLIQYAASYPAALEVSPAGLEAKIRSDLATAQPKLTFDALRQANVQRCTESFHPIDEMNALEWAGAMCGEAGEAANKAKKLWRQEHIAVDRVADLQHGEIIDPREVGKEVADTIIYADLLAARLGLSLEEMVRWAFNAKSDEIGSEIKL